jgi:predicted nucleic acid-binding protein
MKVLLDTNVVLDAILDREPWSKNARRIWKLHLDNKIDANIIAVSVTNIFYICRKLIGLDRAWSAVRLCVEDFPILTVGRMELRKTLEVSGLDFEDDLQARCAEINTMDYIISRDRSGFLVTHIEILSPDEFLELIHPIQVIDPNKLNE